MDGRKLKNLLPLGLKNKASQKIAKGIGMVGLIKAANKISPRLDQDLRLSIEVNAKSETAKLRSRLIK